MLTTTPRTGGSRLQSVFRMFSRQLHGQKRQSGNSKGFQGPESHGENIWIFCHRRTNQIIFSFNEKLEVCTYVAIERAISNSNRNIYSKSTL